MDHIVVDVEIQRTIEETPGGWDATDALGVAVACVWEYQTARMRVYGPEDVITLQARLLRADRISGYNIFNFDFPVIWGIHKHRWLNWATLPSEVHEMLPKGLGGANLKAELSQKCDDLLRRIWVAQGFNPDKYNPGMGGTKLNDVASLTINTGKIGDGGSAPKWYKEGQVQRVANYCADDVAIERDLTDFVDRYGYVLIRRKEAGVVGGVVKIEIPAWRPGR